MPCLVRLLTVKTLADAEQELASLKLDPFTIRNLGPKMLQRVVLVEGLTGTEAAAVKQELHSLGADSAIGRVRSDGADPHVTTIIMGTERQLRKLCSALLHHPIGFSTLATELLRLLEKDSEPPPSWNIGKRSLDLSHRLCVMGVLNVTPDSFSDGSRYFSPDSAVERALQMEAEGADIIDIGGESTRPFAPSVSEQEELGRVIPVLEKLNGRLTIPISIDTYKAAVAREALGAGAEIVNDISALSFDDRMAETVADADAGLVLMHTRGRPAEMQKNTAYGCLAGEVIHYLREALERAQAAGIVPDRIAVDPGIGFGKSADGNLEILGRLKEFAVLGRPILVGTSRKSFIGKILGRESDDRLFGTAATVAIALANGATIFRVHDVKEMRDVVDMAFAIARPLMSGHKS